MDHSLFDSKDSLTNPRSVSDSDNPMQATLAGIIDPTDDQVRRTLGRLGPATIRPGEIFSLMEADPKDSDTIEQTISQCPILTARVLGVINSAAFGMSRQITSVQRAIHLLGANRARAMALAYGLRLLTEQSNLPGEMTDILWANSIQKAIAARKFCEQADPSIASEAYSLALIQDIGLPMLISADLPYFQNHIETFSSAIDWCKHETARFGFDHSMIGQGLLREWHASKKLQYAVLHHHVPPVQTMSGDSPILEMALFLASLLPHLNEEPSPESLEWIQAIHARFLGAAYASPDQFLRQIAQETRKICHQSPSHISTDSLLRKLTAQVTTTAISHAAKLCRIEQDVNQTRQGINDLKVQAFMDPLTRVLNRRGFSELSARRLEMAAAQSLGVCCMLGDLDDFKSINDTYGHDMGDQLLKGVAHVFRKKLGANNLIGRLGGDEFAVFLVGIDRAEALALARKVIDSIENKAVRLRQDLTITAHFSLGAIYTDTNLDDLAVDQLLSLADQAMYQRKKNGKHGLVFKVYPAESPEELYLDSNPKPIARQTPRSR